jgi:eukaryotic-like serine/threonine-protein kinase
MAAEDALARLQAALDARYTIERELGRGGWATVYLAHDAKHDRPVALKVLRSDLAASLGQGRFLREITIAGRLTHPHVLPLYDSGEADGALYYVMPYIEGETLRQRLQREQQLPLTDAIGIAHQVADALAFAHAHNVIHRDIKPENILLEGDQAYLADFGIARAILAAGGDTLSQSGLAVGTPTYMSPEQAGGTPHLDPRSDEYSLGCVVYEMLTGEPPHTGPTVQAILARQQTEPPRSMRVVRPGIPEDVERAVLTALAKAPADRFATVSQFAHALAGHITTGHLAPSHPGGRRGRLALGLLLLVAGGSAVWLAGRLGPGSAADQRPEAAPTSVAVLYFEDAGGTNALRPVADGLTEDLIDALGQVPALRVISPNGVRPYRDRLAPPDSIGRALRVGTLVGGRVERSGDVLRLTVRIIDAPSGLQLQSRTLEYPFGDLFVLQQQLAEEVSRFLRQRLGSEVALRQRRQGTASVAAWELTQEGEGSREAARLLVSQGDVDAARRTLDAADSQFARAGKLDRTWPVPVVLRGWVAADHMQLSEAEPPDSLRAWFRRGVRHADRALELSLGDASAHELRGTLRYRYWLATGADSAEVELAERDLRAGAGASNPAQARAWATLSALLQATGRLAEANLLARQAYDADAFLTETPHIVFRLFYTSLDLGKEQEAVSWCDIGIERFPEDWRFTYCELMLLGLALPVRRGSGPGREVKQAWELVDRLERLSPPDERAAYLPRWQIRIAPVLGRAGLRDSAEAVIRRARAAAPDDPEMDFYEAEARMLLGDGDAALRLLARDVRANPRFKEYVRVYPVFRPLWSDPRFRALVGEPGGSAAPP